MVSTAKRILVGLVGAPHGVRGEVRVKSYTDTPTAIGRYRPLLLEDGRSIDMLNLRALKDDMVVARFKGVDTREAASALTNTQLYVDRAILPPPDEEEFYQADLIGLRVETDDGALVGHVLSVNSYGAGDLLDVGRQDGGGVLVPFTKAFVPVVDVAAGRLVVTAEALVEDDADGPSDDERP